MNLDIMTSVSMVVVVLFVWNIIIQAQYFLLRKKIKMLFQGQKMTDLEGVIFEQIKRSRQNEENLRELVDFSVGLEKMAQKSIQKVGLVRFNPFKDTGSNQSFSLAMLDSFDNGLVISTLFTREGARIYAKPLEAGKSTYALSEEELEAIGRAREGKLVK